MITNAKESHRRKAKGEKLQKEIVADLKKHFPDHADNIKSSPMSANVLIVLESCISIHLEMLSLNYGQSPSVNLPEI